MFPAIFVCLAVKQPQHEGYVFKDDIEYVHDNQVPLWMFGFLY